MPTTLAPLLFLFLSSFSTFSQGNDLALGIYELNRGEFDAAIKQFQPLVTIGYAPAQYQMATVYQHGYGVEKNNQKALALFKLAAKQNFTDAQFELALIYSEGKLTQKNLIKAYQLTRAVANKGIASAQYNLALMYANGTGIEQDYVKAARLYRYAANQNYALAQYNLALLYSEGKGVEKSTEMSLVWNIIASWNGYHHAKQSRLIDERQLSTAKKNNAIEKANRIYKQIKRQLKIKTETAQKKDLY